MCAVSPDEINHMKSIVVDEMLQEMDKNKDGSVTVEEYIGIYGGGARGYGVELGVRGWS